MPSMQSGFRNERIANTQKPNKTEYFLLLCRFSHLCSPIVARQYDRKQPSQPNFLFLLFFTIAVPNSEQGFHPVDILREQSSDMQFYAKA